MQNQKENNQDAKTGRATSEDQTTKTTADTGKPGTKPNAPAQEPNDPDRTKEVPLQEPGTPDRRPDIKADQQKGEHQAAHTNQKGTQQQTANDGQKKQESAPQAQGSTQNKNG